ncbi:MAG: hypothetical protein ABIW38_03145 [Ferruginibacter sp.]
MKQIYINQEILLRPGSSIFNKEWCENDTASDSKKLSQKEQVKQLCWNGMLPAMLPEICELNNEGKQLTLWEINETHNLLDLRMGELDQFMNDEWSINPYVIAALASLN